MSIVRFLLVVLVPFFGNGTINSNANYLSDNYPAKVLEDAKLDTTQLIQKYRYPAQTHYVTTSDGYILRVHRIAREQSQAPVVFLMHGLLDSSATWIEMGPWGGLGYYLHDNGYDVWLGNARGNRYSRNHTTYKPDLDKTFWQFSWHEIGYYDLPAMIDYVLNATGAAKLSYFGHSQGTTAFWVLCSTRPEYNQKVTIMHALAPVAFMKHVKTPLAPLIEYFLAASGDMMTEFLPNTELLALLCFQSKLILGTCMDVFWQIMGKDPQQLNATMLPVVYGHLPAGSSANQLRHYIQLVSSNRFCKYDYGFEENMRRYRKPFPPDYPLAKVNAPVALYYTQNDYLTSVQDVQRLVKLLPNVVEDRLYRHKKWNHMTMLWGVDARKLAHKRMLEILGMYYKHAEVNGNDTKVKPELEVPVVATTALVPDILREVEPVSTVAVEPTETTTETVPQTEVGEETLPVTVSTEQNNLADTTSEAAVPVVVTIVEPTTIVVVTEEVIDVEPVTMPFSPDAEGIMVPEREVEPLPEAVSTDISPATTTITKADAEVTPVSVPLSTGVTVTATTAATTLELTEPEESKAQSTEVDELEPPTELGAETVPETVP